MLYPRLHKALTICILKFKSDKFSEYFLALHWTNIKNPILIT